MEEFSGYNYQNPVAISGYNPQYPYYPPEQAPPEATTLSHPPLAPLPASTQSYLAHQYNQYFHLPVEEVRTLFIAGLPGDVKPREIFNLFREFPGYQSSQVRSSEHSLQAFAFAVFSDQESAVAAMNTLNGMIFDLEKETPLFINLAKSNSRSKRSRTDDGRSQFSTESKPKPGEVTTAVSSSGFGSKIHMPGMVNSAHNLHGYQSTQRDSKSLQNYFSSRNVSQGNNPCPTLFVANLGPTCSEQELIQVFSRYPGFLKLKMQNKCGSPVAFVDFQNEVSSTGALNQLQGAILDSSIGEGMRLEYAKARMGLRKRERKWRLH